MRCERCGKEFDPLRAWHRLCPTCYRLRGRRRHGQMIWLEHPELVLLAVAAGVVLLVIVRGCGLM